MNTFMRMVRGERIALILLVVLSICIQFLFIRPVTLSDQMIYYRTAVDFPRLPNYPNHWTMRLGLVLPVAIAYRMFGHSEISYYFLPFLSTTLLIVSTFLIGAFLFNRRAGIFAALWITFLPYFLLESGNLLPDITASACLTAGITLLLLISSDPTQKKNKWAYLFTGGLFGWAYLAKEYFAIFALMIPFIAWKFKIPKKYLLRIAIGIATVVSIEFAIHFIRYGDPLIRLTTSQPRETLGFIQRDVPKIIGYLFILLAKYRGGISIVLTVLGIIYLAMQSAQKSKAHQVLLVWIAMVYVFFTVLGLLPVLFSWENTVLLRLHVFRYWIPILPPIAIGIAAAVNALLNQVFQWIVLSLKKQRNLSSLILLLVITATIINNVSAVVQNDKFTRTESAHFYELREYLRQNNDPAAIMWIVRDLKIGYEHVLPMYANTPLGKEIWNGSMKYMNTDGEFLRADEITGGDVLIDRVHFNPDSYPIPAYLTHPPDQWRLVFESSNERIAIYNVGQ